MNVFVKVLNFLDTYRYLICNLTFENHLSLTYIIKTSNVPKINRKIDLGICDTYIRMIVELSYLLLFNDS